MGYMNYETRGRWLAIAFAVLILAVALTGCGAMAYQNMTAEQIRATAGTTSCTQYEGLYGNASTIALNTDDTRKGSSSRGKMVITCGKAAMTIENEVTTIPPPAPVIPPTVKP